MRSEMGRNECLICGSGLRYLEREQMMECAICHKQEGSLSCCEQGHYVCNSCHSRGVDAILKLCLEEHSKSPIAILERMMAMPFCHMHGPEHHTMVGAALLTAYKCSGGEIELRSALIEMINRGGRIPGGVCGFWGACGAGLSSGIFLALISGSTPLAVEPFAQAHRLTARSLNSIAEIGGPRCCKRNAYRSIETAIDFVQEHFGVRMERTPIRCSRSAQNNQCIGSRCPYFSAPE